MKITHVPSRLPARAPWRLYHRGRIQWFWTDKAAQKEAEQFTKNIGKMRARVSAREVDELIHCKELLKGTPLLRAVRYYLEANSAALRNANQRCSELLTAFKATLRGRPKYIAEATRHLTLLDESIGKLKAGEVSHEHVERHLAQFESRWSHDDALKFARSFFKWLCGPRIKARTTNPTDTSVFKKPRGRKPYLTLEDAEHMLTMCREYFPGILHAVALQLLAGIRTEEIIRADWSMIRRGRIHLPAEVAKMGEVKGKAEPRTVDWWPKALDEWTPDVLPVRGPLVPDVERKKDAKGNHHQYRTLKHALVEKCRETRPDFKWGQNAMRHSYGTYAFAFWQSGDKTAKLMGERDVDTVHNHYAHQDVPQEIGQKYFSIGCDELEPLPLPPNALALIQKLATEVAAKADHKAGAK